MKIAHVMNWYVPNMGYQENYLPMEQKKLGHDVFIVTSDRAPQYPGFKQHIGRIILDRRFGSGTFTENDVEIHRLPCWYEVKGGKEIILRGLCKKLKKLEPDIVHAHGVTTLLTVQTILLRRKLNYRLFVDDHLHETNFIIDSFAKQAYIKLLKIFYSIYNDDVELFMPVTYASKEILKEMFNIPSEKIVILPLGVDITKFRKSEKLRAEGRKELCLDEDDFLIVSSGKFSEKKDIHVLLKAVGKVSKSHPHVRLLLLGDGPIHYMEKLKRLIKLLKIQKNVVQKGFVPNDELPKWYNASDLGIWPGNPSITVIESIGTGLPVIVPRGDLAYKILFDNDAAIGFRRGDVIDLYRKIVFLIENRNILHKLALNSEIVAKEKLSWKVIARQSLQAYMATLKD